MGIDACIYVKTTDGHEPDLCDSIGSCRIDKVTDAIDKVTDAWKPIVLDATGQAEFETEFEDALYQLACDEYDTNLCGED